jgi:hypothetical protein
VNTTVFTIEAQRAPFDPANSGTQGRQGKPNPGGSVVAIKAMFYYHGDSEKKEKGFKLEKAQLP